MGDAGQSASPLPGLDHPATELPMNYALACDPGPGFHPPRTLR